MVGFCGGELLLEDGDMIGEGKVEMTMTRKGSRLLLRAESLEDHGCPMRNRQRWK